MTYHEENNDNLASNSAFLCVFQVDFFLEKLNIGHYNELNIIKIHIFCTAFDGFHHHMTTLRYNFKIQAQQLYNLPDSLLKMLNMFFLIIDFLHTLAKMWLQLIVSVIRLKYKLFKIQNHKCVRLSLSKLSCKRWCHFFHLAVRCFLSSLLFCLSF